LDIDVSAMVDQETRKPRMTIPTGCVQTRALADISINIRTVLE
jgi:hypothetical protein